MRKFLLVTLIGIVLVMDVYGVVKEIVSYIESKQEVNDVNDMNGVATVVYIEE